MNAPPPTGDLVSPRVRERSAEYAAAFARCEPFRHVVIEDFFDGDYARRLLSEFPPFDRGNARNEAGQLGNKSTVERIRGLGPSYAALDDLIQTRDFLDLVGNITGIPDLLYDPHYFGGGTHENRNGQDLDAHVDFNRHPTENWHRRLNLIVYLNPRWKAEWGGSLELHSDPRDDDDRIIAVEPNYNRCVIFETTEHSWHGFPRIAVPESEGPITRRSVALYFYTIDRPKDELADTHSTIYVDQPLPARFVPGMALDAADIEEIHVLLKRRDQHNQRLYGEITRLTTQLERANAALYAGRLGRLRHFLQSVRAQLRSK
jgi:hypothetical protein